MCDEYFESVPHEEFVDYLKSKHSFDEFPVLLWEETQIDFGETEVAGRNLPMEIDVSDPNKKFKRCRV